MKSIAKKILTYLQRMFSVCPVVLDTPHELYPLLYGKPVCLFIDDSSMRTKNRVKDRLIMITPYGDMLIFSVPGYGCEMCKQDKVSIEVLYKAGLSARSSMVLEQELTKLFEKQTGD